MNTTDAPCMIEYATKPLDFTPHDSKWAPGTARVVTTGVTPSNKGGLCVHELGKSGMRETLRDLSFRPSGIKCSTFGGGGGHAIALGEYEGTLSVCDIERGGGGDRTGHPRGDTERRPEDREAPATTFSVQAHEGIVNAIDGIGSAGGTQAPELVTGGKDGCVKVWDTRVSAAVVSLVSDPTTGMRDCWAVAFGDSHGDERSVLAGFDNGDVKLFDLRTNSVRWETNCKNGIASLEFDRGDIEMNKVVVTTLESKFRCYDMRTRHPVDGFAFTSEVAHRSTVWTAAHLPQNRDVFMTGGGNGGFNIYRYRYPKSRVAKHPQDGKPVGVAGSVDLLNSRVVSTQPIVGFDWSPDREGLCCMCSLDQTMRVFIVTKLEMHR